MCNFCMQHLLLLWRCVALSVLRSFQVLASFISCASKWILLGLKCLLVQSWLHECFTLFLTLCLDHLYLAR